MPLVLGFAGLLGAVLLLTSAITGASFADVIKGNAGQRFREDQDARDSATAGTTGPIDVVAPGASAGIAAGAGASITGPRHPSRVYELFYDPLGGIKHGREIGAIGKHGDHVHFASDPVTVVQIGKLAQRLGLHVGENPSFGGVDPVHVPNSFHYKREAIDVSGSPQLMARFYRLVKTTFGIR